MRNSFLTGKSILLIAPKFFGYEIAVKDKLVQMGADVTFVDDRHDNTWMVKGIIRLNKKLFESDIEKYYADVTTRIAHKSFDIIFLLNPEALPISFLEMCKAKWRKALYVMYMWDSIKNRKHTLDYVPFCNHVFTFDKDDALEHHFHFKPLFYLDKYADIRHESDPIEYDICFMGTLHSDRYTIAKEVKDWCEMRGLRCFFYFFMQSRILYYLDRLKSESITPPMGEVSFSKMNTAEVVNVLASSKVVLDIQHPKQTGLTMRTLETIGAGKKLITTNDRIQNYDFYHSKTVRIIDRKNPTQDLNLDFFSNITHKVPERIVNNYSIGAWLTEIVMASESRSLSVD